MTQKYKKPPAVYSGELVRANDPERYDGIVRALAKGDSLNHIASTYSCSKSTIMAIRRNHPELIKAAKFMLGRSFSEAAFYAADEAKARLLEKPESIPFNQLMIGAGIATDKALLLAGEATERIEHVVRQEDDEFDQVLSKARRAEVIEVDSTECSNLYTSSVHPDNGICEAPPAPNDNENALSTSEDQNDIT